MFFFPFFNPMLSNNRMSILWGWLPSIKYVLYTCGKVEICSLHILWPWSMSYTLAAKLEYAARIFFDWNDRDMIWKRAQRSLSMVLTDIWSLFLLHLSFFSIYWAFLFFSPYVEEWQIRQWCCRKYGLKLGWEEKHELIKLSPKRGDKASMMMDEIIIHNANTVWELYTVTCFS